MLKSRSRFHNRDRSGSDDSIVFFFIIVRYWFFVAVFTVTTTVVGVIYSESKEVTYEASIYLRAPTYSEVEKFNGVWSIGEEARRFTLDDVFIALAHNIMSESLRAEFYNSVKAASEMRGEAIASYDSFSKSIKVLAIPFQYVGGIKSANNLELNRFFISYRAASESEAIDGLEQYIHLVDRAAVGELVTDYKSSNNSIIATYESKVNRARKTADLLRLDRISQLKVSLSLALAEETACSVVERCSVHKIINGCTTSLKTAHAIEQEIRILEGRKDNDFLIPNIRQWQSQIDFYRSIDLDENNLSAFSRDSSVDITVSPSMLERLFTVLLAAMLGGMLSIVLVLGSVAVGRLRS